MTRLREIYPVIELSLSAGSTALPWPRADFEESFLPLSGSCSRDEVGLFMATFVAYNGLAVDSDLDKTIDGIITAKTLIAPGGLAFSDGNQIIYPGCCCGLESWREWGQFADGGPAPWAGHDPWVYAERSEREIRVWSDGAVDRPSDSIHIEMTTEEFDKAYALAEEAFSGFFEALKRWCNDLDAGRAKKLLAKLDRAFDISG